MSARRRSSALPETPSDPTSTQPMPASAGGRARRVTRRVACGAAGFATIGGALVGLPSLAHAATGVGSQAVAIAASEAGKPYVYGGSGPSSFDCSGLVAYVYGRLGIALPHNAAAQYNAMPHVSPAQLQPGDIVFFYNASGIYHDGIYAGGGQIWAAPHTGTVVRLEAIWTSQYFVGRPSGGVATPAPAPAAPTGQPAAYRPVAAQPLLRIGSSGPAVSHLQQLLGITADGAFGPQTLGSVESFQRSHGLGVDGVVGAQTWAALSGGAAPATGPTAVTASYSAGTPLVRLGSTGSAVRSVQQALGITADGVFGPQTLGAVEGFQRSHGLAVDGVVGPQTWNALRGGAV